MGQADHTPSQRRRPQSTSSDGGGGYPTVDQDWWVDDIAVAVKAAGKRDDTPHLAKDAAGHPYIGM